jgi:CheY-like chemotaxis protein
MPHKLLLADDSVTIQRVIELTFADEDIEVIAVGDGKQAIERINIDPPDIVLADAGMPERDGYDVATFIKQNPTLSHIPVVLLTGAFEPVDEHRARAAGCDGVLVKPFEPQIVINRVRELLARKRTPAAWATQPEPPAPTRQTGAAEAAPRLQAPPPSPPPQTPASTDALDEYFDRLDAAFSSFGPTATEGRPSEDFDHAPAPVQQRSDRDLDTWDPVLDDGTGGAQPVEPAPAARAETASEPYRLIAPPSVVSRAEPPAHVQTPPPAPAVTQFEPPAVSRAEPPVAPAVSRVEPSPIRSEPLPATRVEAPAVSRIEAGLPPAPLADAFAALLAAETGGVAVELPAAAPAAPQVSDALVDEVTRRVIERLGETVLRETLTDVALHVAERLVREEIEKLKQSAQ